MTTTMPKKGVTPGPCAFKISHRADEGLKWFKSADGTIYWLATGNATELNQILSNELVKKTKTRAKWQRLKNTKETSDDTPTTTTTTSTSTSTATSTTTTGGILSFLS